jgi:hypothetical protein
MSRSQGYVSDRSFQSRPKGSHNWPLTMLVFPTRRNLNNLMSAKIQSIGFEDQVDIVYAQETIYSEEVTASSSSNDLAKATGSMSSSCAS